MREDDTGSLWQDVLSDVEGKISEPVIKTALVNAKVDVRPNGRVTVRFPNNTLRGMVDRENTQCLIDAFSSKLGEPCQLMLVTDPDMDESAHDDGNFNSTNVLKRISNARATLEQKSGDEMKLACDGVRRIETCRLNPRYTFGTWVVGNHNQLAHAASQAVAREPGTVYNPLFIYASTGLGKTHLMQAIGHEVLVNRSEARVHFVTSEVFTNELIEGIRIREIMNGFNRKYRNVDVLLIDDIHFLIGKTQTQEAFYHIFNTLHDLERQIVITSDRPPCELKTIEERLISRFECGLTVDMSQPNYETRLAILHKKNHDRGFNLPMEFLAQIAGRVDSNIRELEGALTKVSAYQRLGNAPLNAAAVDEVLTLMSRSIAKDRIPKPQQIIEEIADYYRVSINDLMGDRRTAKISVPRQLGMYFCRELTHLSLKDIGVAFGGKDHTTVIYALNRVIDRLSTDESFAHDVMQLRLRLRDRFSKPPA